MKIFNKIFISLFIPLLFLVSCTDELEISPVSSITSAGFWNGPDDCEAYLTGIYDDVRGLVNNENWLEGRSDAFVVGDIGAHYQAFWAQELNASITEEWTSFYNSIYHCNRLLKEIEGINFDDADRKNKLMAETHFLRAFLYFHMARIWGKVPIITEPAENADVELKGRASFEEVFNQINGDIDNAISLFPSDGYEDKSYASKPAAYALQADVKMWTAKVLDGGDADLNAALDAIAEVEASGVRLIDDDPDKLANYRNLLSTENEKNDEIIFAFFFEYPEASNHFAGDLTTWQINVEHADNADEIPGSNTGARAEWAPSPKLRALYQENPGDVREDIVIIDAIAENEDTGEIDTILTCFNKWHGTMYETRRYDNDLIVYRWGGLLLLKAEALAALGQVDDAVAELNKIRNRAGIADYAGPMDQQSVEEEICDERFRELAAELKRCSDLIRFYHEGTINFYDEVPNLNNKQGYPLYWPVHQAVLDENPEIEQTEGY